MSIFKTSYASQIVRIPFPKQACAHLENTIKLSFVYIEYLIFSLPQYMIINLNYFVQQKFTPLSC